MVDGSIAFKNGIEESGLFVLRKTRTEGDEFQIEGTFKGIKALITYQSLGSAGISMGVFLYFQRIPDKRVAKLTKLRQKLKHSGLPEGFTDFNVSSCGPGVWEPYLWFLYNQQYKTYEAKTLAKEGADLFAQGYEEMKLPLTKILSEI